MEQKQRLSRPDVHTSHLSWLRSDLFIRCPLFGNGISYQAPINNPQITSGFGQRDSWWHNGIDMISGSNDWDIKAIERGTVAATGYDANAGNYVVVGYPDGIYSFYFHLVSIHVFKEDSVNQGQTLGIMGNNKRPPGKSLSFGNADNMNGCLWQTGYKNFTVPPENYILF